MNTTTTPAWTRRRWAQAAVLGLGLGLSACGFRLRGQANLSFSTLRLAGKTTGATTIELRNALIASGVRVDTPEQSVLAVNELPQLVMTILEDERQRVVVGQTSAGQVRELELRSVYRYALANAAGRELLGPTALSLTRSLNFNETVVLAKDAEEAQLFRDMQNDIVVQVMRRLSTVRQF